MVPLTLVVVLAPAACNSDPTATDEDELFQALFGTWSWIQATGGIAGTTRTPDSEGYTRTLTFTRPNRNLSTTMGHSTGLIREQCPVW